ncbi:hypothetical protein AMTRI_Chr03g46850 [Amborella trichopoda]
MEAKSLSTLIPTGWTSFSAQISGRARFRLQSKIQLLKAALKSRSMSVSGNFNLIKAELLKTLQELGSLEESRPLSLPEADLISQSTLKYLSTLKKEEIYWYQRSRVNWLKTRNHNTHFFHKIANCRRRDNTISTIKVNSYFLEQPAENESAIIPYFQNLYTATCGHKPPMADLDFLSLSNEQAMWFERPFLEEEILKALDDLAKDKAPDPGGFQWPPLRPFGRLFGRISYASSLSFFIEGFLTNSSTLCSSPWSLRLKGQRNLRISSP